MRPKEIQVKLGISADRIKLYKREGVFSPENPPSGNRGTNYTEKDYDNLKLLTVLTKSGLTCSDIRKLQHGEWTLPEAIRARQKSIDEEIERKRNSLKLLSQILDAKAEFETFDTSYFWDIIQQREEEGKEFIRFEDLYGYEPVSLVRSVECPHCHTEQEIDLEDYVYNESSDERESGMGPDVVYSFDTNEYFECPYSGKVFRVSGWIREYPMGAYDSEDILIEALEGEKDE